ncbi:WD repeat- and FYVE domain-containing protein 4 isoform X1 [Ornithorhynchus anatinus]|uniref:WDFY family member 4 n=1 Tax=Ornithorhynchus anatinus TaxID=9258 RepID=A0A6I8PE67_ORNAN|nr:WD repeat- and FYVE domain-containing protein 4 isoform X1 [Ornithorhynchus anatinus]XP_028916531.1 WD repeat- and FYVE domain-containing protein 4 isoform X1 [Ornithorhynchus anatinus]
MSTEEKLAERDDAEQETHFKAEGGQDTGQHRLLREGQIQCSTALWEIFERQFLDYEPSIPLLSPEEQQKKLLGLLPLFLKAWEQSAGIICFSRIQDFASEVSKVFVRQIQNVLAFKPAEAARLAIGQFLQWRDVENDGYLLLKSVFLLTQADPETLENIIKSGLPGVLLQCLYLLFAFSLDKDECLESDIQIQKMFVQVMLRLYSEPQGVEELLTGRELPSLLIATSTLWDQSSPSWKGPTFWVLRTISRAQNQQVTDYLQETDCVKTIVQNLTRLSNTSPAHDLSDVVTLLLCFVKDSYPNSSALLLDLESSGGYPLLLKVLLWYEGKSQREGESHLEELLELMAWLTICGKTELKVFDNVTYPQLEDFKLPQSGNSGMTVKNLQAFQVLQTVFQKSIDPCLCRKILSTIKSIWDWNARNFFLLEWTLQPISQFVEIIHLKPPLIQTQFFQLLESVVFELNFIPYEIFKKVQNLIKVNTLPTCTLTALKTVHQISLRHVLFTDIFRDSGLLGLLLAQLRKQAKIMRKSGNRELSGIQDVEHDLICVMLKVVASLLHDSIRNTVVLKDHGMVPFIKIFLDDGCYRNESLAILEQLSLINTEEYMSIIIGALCSSTQGELQLKLDLLKSLHRILENPKGRSAFRTSHGFNGLLSLLSDMEGALRDPPSEIWATTAPSQTLDLILYTLCGIMAALHHDPINGDFFRKNNLFEKLADDLWLLGCFATQESRPTRPLPWANTKARTLAEFLSAASSSPGTFPLWARNCLTILSYLDSMAKGSLHPWSCSRETESDVGEVMSNLQSQSEGCGNFEKTSIRSSSVQLWPELTRLDEAKEVITHPGMVCVMIRLLPGLYHDDHPQLSKEIQCSVADHIQSLVKSERNRQVVCESGLLKTIIVYCHDALNNSNDMVHLSLIRVFEKLASQSIEPDILRQFLGRGLCVPASAEGKILNSSNFQGNTVSHPEENKGSETSGSEGTGLPREAVADVGIRSRVSPAGSSLCGSRGPNMALQTAMSLISMTAPRNMQAQRTALSPSFVEFDMSAEGYGCLFIPTLSTVVGTSTDYSISGGMGMGTTRSFPPSSGLTFSSWFLISKLGSIHYTQPVRFLTLVRHMARTEQPYVCFSVSLQPEDLTLVISTEEKEFQPLDIMEPEETSEPPAGSRVQFKCVKLITTGQWHHLAIVVAKEMKRTCVVRAFIDGQLVGSAKMLYIQSLPGPFPSMDPSSFIDVYGYIATPPVWSQKSPLIWRLGPTFFLEEAISVETLEILNKLGPRYCGNLQAVHPPGDDSRSEDLSLVAEEKVSLGLNVASSSITYITEIKSNYNEVDSRLIAKEMKISSRDNSTPVFLVRNSAGHLSGSLRAIGAVAVGHLGVRVFHSSPAANSLNFIGGPAVLLRLISLATDDHTMYAAVKVLHSVLCSSAMCAKLMKHICGYQILAFLLKKKMALLNNRIFQLLLSITGTAELGFETSIVTNVGLFQHVLCNFELWINAPENLDLVLFSHLVEILRCPSREAARNAEVAHQVQLVPKLVFLFNDSNLSRTRVTTIIAILGHLLKGHFNTQDVLRIGLFIVYTLKPSSVNEREIILDRIADPSVEAISQTSGRTIWLRNQLLEMLLDVICSSNLHLSSGPQEETFLTLGPDWFLLFIQSHLNPTTIVLGMKLLLCFLYNPALRARFKDGMSAGSWVGNSAAGVDILMDNIKSRCPLADPGSCLISGFRPLHMFLAHHINIPEVYFLVSGLFLQTPLTEIPGETEANLDCKLQWLLQNHHTDNVHTYGLCPEGALLLLEMVKVTINQPFTGSGDDSWKVTYPGNVMQFLCLIYHSYPQDPMWGSLEFLQTLAAVIFPSGTQKGVSENLGAMDHPVIATEDGSCTGPPAGLPTVHPARKQVCDFIRILLMEILISTPMQKQWHPLEFLLEASPENATNQQKRCFQSEILLSIMDIFHIISEGGGKGVLTRPKGNKDPQYSSETTSAIALANVSYFTQKLVEKLYNGMFTSDPKQILLFITEQIMAVIDKAAPQKETIVGSLYSSLNRIILYCLSKPQQTLPECLSLLGILNFLREHWDIIFATYNSHMGFIICLMYCLFQLSARSYPEGFGLDPNPRITPYHQVFLTPNEEVKEEGGEDLPTLSDVQHNILKCVLDIWRQLVSQRRQVLEDAFKMDLSVKQGECEVRMEDVTPLWEETTAKSWQQFLASEKKSLASKSSLAHQNKHSSWSESLSSAMKLMPGKNIKEVECKAEEILSHMENCRRNGQELYASLYKDYGQRQRCMYRKAAEDWAKIKEQLFSEEGLWGAESQKASRCKWVLDWREGPARMRKRIRRISTSEALMRGNNEDNQTGNSTQASAENQDEQMLNGAEKERDEMEADCNQLTFFPALHESLHSEDFLELCRERQSILQEFVPQEKVWQKYSVVIVQGHVVSEGVLLFGQRHFYICENFTLSPLGDVYCTRHCLSNISDSFIFNMCSKDWSSECHSCQRHAYRDIKALHRMRFLLQEMALEIFFQNGFSKFLVFHNGDRSKAFKSFCSFQPCLKTKGISEDTLNIRKVPGTEKTMLQKWQKRDISNFEYLMYLNTLAGRTYNDYMQYPVFPWILADYTSKTLNLMNPRTFRDLSKPMGAQTKERKLKFTQRYKEVEKSEGDLTVRCHYCTHYSSAIIVASYLVRMKPFTQTFCSLQGGSFDVADRMFHSVQNAWESASRENMSDVRELTPEFFYLPEFLTNCNEVEFGRMQDGTILSDVLLPPWAEGDAQKFISLHRQALESEYVSAHLHHWIDLIFGYKQHGPAAVEAINTFHPYFYGNRVNLNNITDPIIKNTILGFVSNFGQVPRQLFTKPHPARTAQGKASPAKDTPASSGPAGQPHSFLSSLQNLKPSPVTVRDMFIFSPGSESPKGAIGHIVPTEKSILAVEKNKVLIPHQWNKTFSWGFDDYTCCLGNYGSDKNSMTFETTSDWGKCLCVVCPTPTTIVTSGTSSVVCVWELSIVKDKVKGLHLKQALYGHMQAVTCLAASVTYSLLVSGSSDRTCIIWDLDHLVRVSRLPAHGAPLSAVAISDSTGEIASCAGTHLYLWNANGQPLARINTAQSSEGPITCCGFIDGLDWDTCNIIITGSGDGIVRLWKTEYMKISDQSGVPESQEPTTKALDQKGNTWEKSLVLCRELDISVALTGKPSKTNPAITALAVSRNQTKIFAGDEKGRIFCWSMDA